MDFNILLEHAGDFGLYQKLLCAVLVVPSAALCALVYFTQFFIIMVPDHWCRVPMPSGLNLTAREWMNVTLPVEHRDGQSHFSQCQMYDVNFTEYDAAHLQPNDTWPPRTDCRYGWNYDFSALYPTIATELNWVCKNDMEPYIVQTVFYVGTSIGCILFGHISDKFGRRPAILLSYSVAFTAGIVSSFMPSFVTFAVMRLFMGLTIIPLSEDPIILALEYIGVQKRTLVMIFWTSGYILFSIICPWIAYGLRNWQLLSIITTAPLLLIVLAWKWIPESASWLLMQGRRDEAIKQLKTVAKLNGRKMPDKWEENLEIGADEQSGKKSLAIDLFRTPRMRRNSVVQGFLWFIIYCCYHTNTHNTSNISSDIYTSFTYGAMVEIPASLIILFGLDRLGRKWPLVSACIVAGIAGITIMAVPQGHPKTFLALALVMRVCLATAYNVIIQYSAELYPTVLRGRGVGYLRVMGSLGLYVSPIIVYTALTTPSLPLLTSGAMVLAAGFMAVLLPETLNQHLPHTVEEGESFGRDQGLLECPCLKRKTTAKREVPTSASDPAGIPMT